MIKLLTHRSLTALNNLDFREINNFKKDIYKYKAENNYKYFIKKVRKCINAFQSIVGPRKQPRVSDTR